MSVLNISARPYGLTVAGLDCLTALVSADGAFQHYDQSGLALINATFILKRPFGWTEKLDDRTNPRWARGQLVQTLVARADGTPVRAPILGHLYILNSEFDGISELKIECGCILNLLLYRTPAGEGACLNLGELTDLTAIAQKLLAKAGAPPLVDAIAGYRLRVPLRKLTNESYIALFGKLCWANGYLAWQNNLGQIRARPTLSGAFRQNPEVGIDDVRYQRLTGIEVPPEKIRISGTIQTLKKVEDETAWIEREYGPAKMIQFDAPGSIIIKETRYKETIRRDLRKKFAQTDIWQPKGLVVPAALINNKYQLNSLYYTDLKTEEFVYERESDLVSLGGILSDANCKEIDEGRLLVTSYYIWRPEILGLQQWYAFDEDRLESARQSRPYLESAYITAERGKVEYFYYDVRDDEEEDTSGGVTGGTGVTDGGNPKLALKIVSQKELPVGELLPQGNWLSPKELTISEMQIRTWTLIRKGEWEYAEKNYQALSTYQPDLVEKLIEEDGQENSQDEFPDNRYWMKYVQLVPSEQRFERSNSGQATPPAPERFPIEWEVKERNFSTTVRLPGLSFGYLFRDREREFTVDSGLLVSEEQARMLGRIEGTILWGRYKGQACTVAVTDGMFGVNPLDLATWTDFYGSRHTFWMDGVSLAMTQTRVLLAYDGIWQGSVVVVDGVETEVKPFQEELEVVVDGAGVAIFTVLPQSSSPTPDIAIEVGGAGGIEILLSVAEMGYLVDESGGYILDENGDRFILGYL